MDSDRPLTNLEKLAIAGYAAARIRGSKVRKITTVDADGKPLRVIDSDEMQGKLMERQGIELDANGMIECVACSKLIQRPRRSGARICLGCRRLSMSHVRSLAKCSECGSSLGGYGQRLVSLGRSARCSPCANRAARCARTPAERSASAHKRWSLIPKAARSEAAKRRWARVPTEARKRPMPDAVRASVASRRRASTKAAWGRKTEEERRAIGKKIGAALTAEQKSAACRKAWVTRRANAANNTNKPKVVP